MRGERDMTQMRKVLAVTEETTLLPFLLREVTGKSRNTVKGLLTRRQVMVDGTVVTRFDAPLLPGQQVTLLPPEAAGAAELPFPVLYQDRDLIAVDKPAGLLSMANERERYRTAYRMATDYMSRKNPRGRVFIVHRLDRDTSGVLLFAKSEAVKRAYQDNWGELVRRRGYLAVVEGRMEKAQGTVRSRLRETTAHRVYSAAPGQDGREAVTRFTLQESGKRYSLLEVDIDTGRKNQIRVHMADLGHPVVGDRKYGAAASPLNRLCLHAHILELVNPVTGRDMLFKAPVPKEFYRLVR